MVWSKTPRYLCRKFLVFGYLKNINTNKKVLEIGCGAGDFVYSLTKKGFYGKAIDISDEAIKLTKLILNKMKNKFKIEKKDFIELKGERYDIIIALEVLEHFKDDFFILKQFKNLLNKNGILILSVPARKKFWDINDVWAGHIRRYEKKDLSKKLNRTGFNVEHIWSYGYPLINIIKPFRNILVSKDMKNIRSLSKTNRTVRSGIERGLQTKFSFLFNNLFLLPFFYIQKLFLKYDLGDGYIIISQKR